MSELRRGNGWVKFESEDSAPVPEITPTYHFFFLNFISYFFIFYIIPLFIFFFKIMWDIEQIKSINKIIENRYRIELNIMIRMSGYCDENIWILTSKI